MKELEASLPLSSNSQYRVVNLEHVVHRPLKPYRLSLIKEFVVLIIKYCSG